jgi:hypothetical protein
LRNCYGEFMPMAKKNIVNQKGDAYVQNSR